jgi:hypothetical protein
MFILAGLAGAGGTTRCYLPLRGKTMAFGHLQQATTWLMRHATADPDDADAGATDYMHLMGLVALGYMWCRIVEAAPGRLARNTAAERIVMESPAEAF